MNALGTEYTDMVSYWILDRLVSRYLASRYLASRYLVSRYLVSRCLVSRYLASRYLASMFAFTDTVCRCLLTLYAITIAVNLAMNINFIIQCSLYCVGFRFLFFLTIIYKYNLDSV